MMYANTPEAAEARISTTMKALRKNIGDCREWVGIDRCDEPSEYVLWGKLIAADGLGPRCYEHAAKHVGARALTDPSWAIIDLWRLAREIDAEHFPGWVR